MEQYKYREQIQNSACTPSDDSWEKLNMKLTDYDNNKKNNKRLFMKYAVSVLIIISAGFYFVPSDDVITVEESIAVPNRNKTRIESSFANTETEPSEDSSTGNSIVLKKIESKPPANEITNYEVEENLALKNGYDGEKNENYNKEGDEYFKANTFSISSKITQHGADLDDEVEALLKNANLNIEKNGQYINITKISAIDLLGEIEDDIEKGNRRKLFEKIIITINNPTAIVITERSN